MSNVLRTKKCCCRIGIIPSPYIVASINILWALAVLIQQAVVIGVQIADFTWEPTEDPFSFLNPLNVIAYPILIFGNILLVVGLNCKQHWAFWAWYLIQGTTEIEKRETK